MAIICVSGGFDPLHKGHVNLMEEAATWGKVFVILNSDAWLIRKKNYHFMNYADRKQIIEALRCVAFAVDVDDSDNTVCEALRRIRPDFFGNGGDRTSDNTPELKLCLELGIKPIFNLGGEKIASSSQLVKIVMGPR